MSIPAPPSAPIGNGKAYAAVIGGAATTIVVYILNQFLPQPLPAEIAGAIQTLIVTGSVYFTPHGGA